MPTKKKKGNQQKAKSPTVKTVSQPKPEEPPGAKDSTSNLCDDCAFDFGACEGKPKFASEFQEGLTGAEADRVVQCVTFKNVGDMPTAEELAKKGKPVTPFDLALAKLDDFGKTILKSRPEIMDIAESEDNLRFGPGTEPTIEQRADVLVVIVQGIVKEEGGRTDGLAKDTAPTVAAAPAIGRPDPKRFEKEEDFGNCQSCDKPLKRTALNRYIDAIRCVNGRCRAFRVVVKNIPTGAK
jgi:hypothetical protein